MAIGKEVQFGFNNFQTYKTMSVNDSIAQMVINVLTARPGNFPSLPHIGIDIRKYFYRFDGELTASDLRSKIHAQCSAAINSILIGEVVVTVTRAKGRDIMLIVLPITGLQDDKDSLAVMFGMDSNGEDIGDKNIAYRFVTA